MSQPHPRLTGALSASALAHAGAAALFLALAAGRETVLDHRQPERFDTASLVWVPRLGPEGGRAPAGDTSQPARRLLLAGSDRVSRPAVERAPVESAPLAPEPPRIEPIAIAAEPLASALEDLPGAVVSVSLMGLTGVGPATGSGGDGAGPGGFGRGANGPRGGLGAGPGPGNGVAPPRLVSQVKPNYTPDAMRARIQGIVALEAVVLPDGTVGDVRVVRSLDSTFGLDVEAVKAVKQWRFVPGTRSGRPIPIIVSAELTFTLR